MKKKRKNKLTNGTMQLTKVAPVFVSRQSSFVIILLIAMALTGCTKHDHAGHEVDTYTCPMHPTVISDRPGTCPVCGMDLVRKARPGEEVKITDDLSRLIKSPNEVVVASIRSIKGEYKSVPVSVRAQGVVTYDTRNVFTIPTRVGGRLERSFVKYEHQQIYKGQKIAEIYSTELVTAQRELLFLLENDAGNTALISAAKAKLKLLGMSSSQINTFVAKKEASSTVSIYSPYSGYIITRQPPPSASSTPSANNSTGGMGDGMPSTSSPSAIRQQPTQPSLVREGDYVTAGQTLFTVVTIDGLRIELDLPGIYSGTVKEGNSVDLSFVGNQHESARVDFVQPFFTEGQDFLKVRVFTKRPDLRIGSLVSATVLLTPIEALWVPKEAVLALGIQEVVFLKDRGVFKPKTVTIGASAEGMIEIKSGLTSSDEIAANAHFLVDSESFIRPMK